MITIYSPYEIDRYMHEIEMPIIRDKWGVPVYNVPCAFDTESTSFYNADGEKQACMYAWMFAAGDRDAVILGRTWDEFNATMDYLAQFGDTARLIVYVHNLQWDFQFMRKHLEWSKIFAVSSRRPVYARTNTGIEFRCSYILTGYSLSKIGEQLHTHTVRKMTGDLDYSLLRHSGTPLTPAELEYCTHDVRVLTAYITEQIEQEHGIVNIPLTNTGYVRRYVRDACMRDHSKPARRDRTRQHYHEYISGLSLTPDEYDMLQNAFQGGFTHANSDHVSFTHDNRYIDRTAYSVTSYDITSSYPYVMCAERAFPVGVGRMYDDLTDVIIDNETVKRFNYSLNHFCCLFSVEFLNIECTHIHECYLAESHCKFTGATIDNHRIVNADHLITTITDVDMQIIKQVYRWDKMRIIKMYRYMRGYLPKPIIRAILSLYQDKTRYKDDSEHVIEYMHAKGWINSVYGMAVTNIMRTSYTYDNGNKTWHDPIKPDIEKTLKKYNAQPDRFLSYAWGVWVTALARRNLWGLIINAGADYIYSDTDSVKMTNADAHIDYIKRYNEMAQTKLQKMCAYYKLDFEMCAPTNVKGVKKPLGEWHFDGFYTRFKTLGAKRYLVSYPDDHVEITVAGLRKQTTVDYLRIITDNYTDGMFRAFNHDMYIPAEWTGKKTHTYIDDEISGVLIDCTGKAGKYHELSCIHLENQDYSMNVLDDFINYLGKTFYDVEEIDNG